MKMKKTWIVSKLENGLSDGSIQKELEKILSSQGFEMNEDKPDFIITLGGDGTFLIAEREYPGIPKLILRDSEVCKLCVSDNNDEAIDHFISGQYFISEHRKLDLEIGGKNVLATNDVTIRNADQREALRFVLEYGGKKIKAIGDGVVFATPQGSTGYFHSITRKNFRHGIGVAFNNPTEEIDSIIVENGSFDLLVTRGEGIVTCDNDKKIFKIGEGDRATVSLSKKTASVIELS